MPIFNGQVLKEINIVQVTQMVLDDSSRPHVRGMCLRQTATRRMVVILLRWQTHFQLATQPALPWPSPLHFLLPCRCLFILLGTLHFLLPKNSSPSHVCLGEVRWKAFQHCTHMQAEGCSSPRPCGCIPRGAVAIVVFIHCQQPLPLHVAPVAATRLSSRG